MQTKLSRSRTNRMICGVCGGLGDYLQIDPVIIRIVFVLMALGHGAGVLVYLILCLIMPEAEVTTVGMPAGQGVSPAQAKATAGMVLLIAGIVFLSQNLNIVALHWLNGDVFWPLLLIVGGIVLLRRRVRNARTTPGEGG